MKVSPNFLADDFGNVEDVDCYIVGEVSFVELFEDEHGKPRGCGVVEFEKLEHARIALDKMNRFELKGRHLVVKEVRILFWKIS